VTRLLREKYEACELPIIMITCSSLEEDVIKVGDVEGSLVTQRGI
jgi:hypothetical protein